MLVLTRRVGEEVVIEGGIIVTVVAVKGCTIRLGISAPRPSAWIVRRCISGVRSLWVEQSIARRGRSLPEVAAQ